MKKLIISIISIFMLLSLCNCFQVSASSEIYPPVETGNFINKHMLEDYSYETAGNNPQPITLDESYYIQVHTDDRVISLDNEFLESQIKNDYCAFVNYKVRPEQIIVNYFGTLSDGSLLVFIDGPFSYTCVPNYRVINKYVYITSSGGNDIVIYKNNTFLEIIDAYQKGVLSDELLDETAEKLCFAKFVNPNEEPSVQPSTESTTDNAEPTTAVVETTIEDSTLTEPTESASTETTVASEISKSLSTSDTPKNNNINGAVQTGAVNVIVCLSVIAIVMSGAVMCLLRKKKI